MAKYHLHPTTENIEECDHAEAECPLGQNVAHSDEITPLLRKKQEKLCELRDVNYQEAARTRNAFYRALDGHKAGNTSNEELLHSLEEALREHVALKRVNQNLLAQDPENALEHEIAIAEIDFLTTGFMQQLREGQIFVVMRQRISLKRRRSLALLEARLKEAMVNHELAAEELLRINSL